MLHGTKPLHSLMEDGDEDSESEKLRVEEVGGKSEDMGEEH